MSLAAAADTPVSRVSIGVRGSVSLHEAARIGATAEQAGYHGLWVSDSVDGDALAALAAAASATTRLVLSTGVLPLDRHRPRRIAERVRDLPVERVRIGLGAGHGEHPVERVSAAVAELRSAVTCPIVIGALGPRMLSLAASAADGVLANWVDPATLIDAPLPRPDGRPFTTAAYARTVTSPADYQALESEISRKAAKPAYARRMPLSPMKTIVAFDEDPLHRIDVYLEVVDELVLRLISAPYSIPPSLSRPLAGS